MGLIVSSDGHDFARNTRREKLNLAQPILPASERIREEIGAEFDNSALVQYAVVGLRMDAIANEFSHFLSFFVMLLTQRVGGKMKNAMSKTTKSKTSNRKNRAIGILPMERRAACS